MTFATMEMKVPEPFATLLTTMQSLARMFVSQYSSCSNQQIPQLSGMMGLLVEIGMEEDIKT